MKSDRFWATDHETQYKIRYNVFAWLSRFIGQSLPEQAVLFSVEQIFGIPHMRLKLESFYFYYNGKKNLTYKGWINF